MSIENLTFPQARQALNALSEHAAEWAGLPMPIEGEKMVIHPSYPWAKVFNQPSGEEEFTIINRWPCADRRAEVVIYQDAGSSKRQWGFIPWPLPVDMQLRTLGIATSAYEIDAEVKAMEKLQSLLKPHAFRTYVMCGSFLESSPRSGIFYLFRRMRPTLAMSASTGEMRFLCGLCLHPIGFYKETWAGAMVPTDEVIAHLMLMRGDEHRFWKQANQHPGFRPEAGL